MQICYQTNINNFKKIPGCPLTYWVSSQGFENFSRMHRLEDYCIARIGMVTGDTARFIRFWQEINFANMGLNIHSVAESISSHKKWFPIQNGGDYRKWYGNIDSVVNYENDGFELKNDNYVGTRIRSHNYNGELAFKPGLSWTTISSSRFSCRISTGGYIYDTAGPFLMSNCRDDDVPILAFLDSSVAQYYLSILNPTLNFPPGYLLSLPYDKSIVETKDKEIRQLTNENILLTKKDWDSFEISWDFKKHPLI